MKIYHSWMSRKNNFYSYHTALVSIYDCCRRQEELMLFGQTKDENPGKGARDRAILFMIICPPFRLTTALPSGSESV